MGFKLPQRTADLTFKGDFEGAKVEVTLDQPLGAFIEAQAMQEKGDIGGLCRFVAHILLSWNLEDNDGKPIPATEEGVLQQPMVFVDALLTAWMDTQLEPTPEKKGKSKSTRA